MILVEKERDRKTLQSIANLCDCLQTVDDAETRLQILTSCQEAVIALGEKLESNTNPIDQKGINEARIISQLEQFCELVYQCSLECTSRVIVDMKALLTEISVALDCIERTFRVVFLPYKAEMWDSLESIWRAFSEDERCEVAVVPIPFFEANRQTNQWEPCYDGNNFPKDVPVVHFQDYLLGEKRPDLVFVHNPFDEHNYVTQVHPAYHSKELKKHCGKLAYVPYYVNPGFLSDDYNLLPLLHRADYLIFQCEEMKESCKEYPYYDRVLPLGSPKFDKVIRLNNAHVTPPEEWGLGENDKKRLLLNTTITDFLQYGDVLMQKLHRFFEKVAFREDVVIVWRPHPLLEGTVKAMRPQFVEQYQELVDYFVSNKVGVFDRTPDVSRAVAATDAYIGSGYSSIIALYEVCNKPVFRFNSQENFDIEQCPERQRANACDVFKMTCFRDFFGGNECPEYMFEDFVDDLVNNRLEEVLRMQKEAEAGISNNLDGTCGEKVHEYIMKDLMKINA
ncbi:MAG: CDP-glycerol glycerophosphotransferase family protein [Lachnospiraceae bacterium]